MRGIRDRIIKQTYTKRRSVQVDPSVFFNFHIFLSTLLFEEQQLVRHGHVVHFYLKDCIISE